MKKIFLSFILFTLSFPLFAYDKEKDFSLIISGGISLGAYEAGYNWGLLKYLNHLKHHEKKVDIQMHSITGASAGAINALLSSLSWCRSQEMADRENLIDDNLFYHMWTEIDFEDLFIDKEFGTDDPSNQTSLFSRTKIEKLATEAFLALDKPYYEPGCKIAFGFAVTRVEPKISKIQNIKISNKLFHIPLYLSVDDSKKAKIEDNFDLSRDNIIHLSSGGNPSKEQVLKALYASSAFPIAFEQVELEYLHHGKFEKALFLDGGVFDNVPLDFAIRLSKYRAKNYIFMDPKHMRKEHQKKSLRVLKQTQSPINSAIDLIGDIYSASESSILYNTLAQEFGNTQKEIQISSRYFPITGKFLEHFGAFLDKGFRQYDYYVGVYDAIIDSTKYLCSERTDNELKNQRCQKVARKSIYKLLSKESDRAKYILNLLSFEEFGYRFEEKDYLKQYDLFAIFESIKDLNFQNMEEFYTFINKLNKYNYKATNSYLKHTLSHPDNWYRRPLSSIVQRIVTLEKENSNNLTKPFASIAAYTTGTFYKTKSGYTYNPISAPINNKKLWIQYFPYELSYAKNILSIGYENYYYIDNNSLSFLIPKAIEVKPSLSYVIQNQNNQEHFLRADINLNYELKKDMITLGLGASIYQDLDSPIDKNIGFGNNVYLDFLNILRITYTKRNDYRGKNNYIYIGINDIPSFLYWMLDE